MALGVGSQLGPYEITGVLGAGGMGVVYAARDARLGRNVAIKVLPPEVRTDAARLQRFEFEARAVAALSHPNILAIYDVGTHQEGPWVVTELLEGSTLRELLGSGALSQHRALEYAGQVARGLAAAHERGIVHRDVKPENIFVTRDEQVKLLDFGLARSTEVLASATLNQTASGAVLGTAGYMAPEQVRGKEADARSDLFAFGAVLYELLAGRRAFEGATAVERGYAILNAEPPAFATLGKVVSPGLERLIQRCLEKLPERRFQSARDLGYALDAISSGAISAVTTPAPSRAMPWKLVLLAGVALAAGITLGLAVRRPTEPAQKPGAPGNVPTFQRLTFGYEAIGTARFTPDGKAVVYSSELEGGPLRVYSITLGQPEPRALTGPNTDLCSVSRGGDLAVMLAPSETLPSRIARIPLAGGEPRDLVEGAIRADWGGAGEALAILKPGVLEFPSAHPIAKLDSNTRYYPFMRVSPRGDAVALVGNRGFDGQGSVEIVRLDGSRQVFPRRWAGSVMGLAWAPKGDELWFSAGEDRNALLWAATLDGKERLVFDGPGNFNLEDIDGDGRVLLRESHFRTRVEARFPSGKAPVNLSWLDAAYPYDLSSDGSLALFFEGGEAMTMVEGRKSFNTLHVRPTDGSPAVRIGAGRAFALSPDGKWAVTSSQKQPSDAGRLTLVPTGAGESRELPGEFTEVYQVRWFADLKRLLIRAQTAAEAEPRLWVQDLDGTPRRLPAAPVSGMSPPSPDGTAVIIDRGGTFSLLRIEDGHEQPLPRLSLGDRVLQWRSDGSALYVWRRQRGATTGNLETPPRPLDAPSQIELYEVATGKRTPWYEWVPSGCIGEPYMVLVSSNGKVVITNTQCSEDRLFIGTGLH